MQAGETLGLDLPLIQDGNLSPNEQRSIGDPTKIGVNGSLPIVWEPEGLFRYLAQFQQGAADPVVLEADESFRHKLAPSETDVDLDRAMSLRMWRDDGLASTLHGLYVSQWTLNAAVRSHITGQVQLTGESGTYYSPAAALTEAGSPERPRLRGFPTHANSILADTDIFILVDTGATSILVKRGSASTYDGTAITVTPGTWVPLTDENDDPIGDPDMPVALWVDSIAGWTADDEWRFDYEIDAAPWSPSFPSISRMNEIHASLTMDLGAGAVSTRVSGLTLTANHPIEAEENLGGRFADGVVRTGERVITGTINRRQLDTTFVKAIIAGQPFELDFIVTSRVAIAASDDLYRMRFVLPKGLFSGRTPNVQSAGTIVESLGVDFYPDATNGTHPDDLTVYLDNSFADLEAA
jgi:hypothetical protein